MLILFFDPDPSTSLSPSSTLDETFRQRDPIEKGLAVQSYPLVPTVVVWDTEQQDGESGASLPRIGEDDNPVTY
jgi:hypothetical protein